MLNRTVALPIALLAAGCAALGLYLLTHYAFGVSRHSIVVDSFGSAGFLAVVLVIGTFTRRGTK